MPIEPDPIALANEILSALVKQKIIEEFNADEIVHKKDQYTQQLKADCLVKANKETFNGAVDLLAAEIAEVEQEKTTMLFVLCKDYIQKFKALVEQHCGDKWNVTQGLLWQELSSQLAHPDINESKEFKIAVDILKSELQSKIKDLETQSKYVYNRKYAEHMQLLGLGRFPGKLMLTSQELVDDFKKQINFVCDKEHEFKIFIEKHNSEIKTLEHEAQRLVDDSRRLSRELLDLTPNKVIAKIPAEQQHRSNRINEIKYDLEQISKDQIVCVSQTQKLFKKQIVYQRRIKQLQAEMVLAKRQAVELIPTRYIDFLPAYTSQSLAMFSQQMQSLAAGNKTDLNKLFGLVADVIRILPDLGMPDLVDTNGRRYSEQGINNVLRSFIILEQAKKAASLAVKQDPSDLYLGELKTDIEQAFEVLSNKILIHPRYEVRIGFELLPEEMRVEYIKKGSAIDTSTPLGLEQAKDLNRQIWQAIEKTKYNKIRSEVDNALIKLGVAGERLQLSENVQLYDGLINQQVVLYELALMQNTVAEYLRNHDFSDLEIKKAKEHELEQLGKILRSLQDFTGTELQKIYVMLDNRIDQQSISKLLMQEAEYYFTILTYIASGEVAGYGISKVEQVMSDLLSGLIEYDLIKTKQTILPFTGFWEGDFNYFTSDAISLQEKLSEIRRKVETFKQSQTSGIQKFGALIKEHKPSFWGVMLGFGTLIGIAMSTATMGITESFVTTTEVGEVGIYGGWLVLGLGGALSFGSWFNNKAMRSPVERLYDDVTITFEKAKIDLNINITNFEHIKNEAGLSMLIKMLNIHFQDQMAFIHESIKTCDPTTVKTKEQEVKFESKLVRELSCMQDMLKIKVSIEELLKEIDTNKMVNPAIVFTKHVELKKLLNSYLDINYKVYNKTEAPNKPVETQVKGSAELIESIQHRAYQNSQEKLEDSRHQYVNVTPQFSDHQEKESMEVDMERENIQVAGMISIKTALDRI